MAVEPLQQFPEGLHESDLRASTGRNYRDSYFMCCASRNAVAQFSPDWPFESKRRRGTRFANSEERIVTSRKIARRVDKVRATGGVPRRDATVAAVRHAVEILRGFSTHDAEQGISEIARRVGLHKSSVSRLVSTLEQDRLLERDPDTHRVRLGVGLIGLAAPLLANVQVVEVARSYLVQLARDAGETISLSVWDGAGAVSLEQALGGRAVAHYAPPGRRNPAHCTASGKLLLAYAPAAELDRIVASELRRYTPRTICDAARLRAEIRAIRTRGYAINAGEFAPDVGAVAAAVYGAGGNAIAAITATVPMYRFDAARRAELVSLVGKCATLLSARLRDLNLQRIKSS